VNVWHGLVGNRLAFEDDAQGRLGGTFLVHLNHGGEFYLEGGDSLGLGSVGGDGWSSQEKQKCRPQPDKTISWETPQAKDAPRAVVVQNRPPIAFTAIIPTGKPLD